MFDLTVLASSSAGNCYRVSDGTTSLLLECGIPWAKIKKGLKFKTSEISGVLVSHEHGDHAKSVKDAAKAGLDIYTSKGTAEAVGVIGHRIHRVKAKQQVTIGTWTVLFFETVHDAAEPLGFLLMSQTSGAKVMFITDTSYCRYRFTKLTHMMIECNFSDAILAENVAAGRVHPAMAKRVQASHMSIDRVCELLQANDLSCLREIHLMHLSNGNSNEAQFKKRVQAVTGVPVYVC